MNVVTKLIYLLAGLLVASTTSCVQSKIAVPYPQSPQTKQRNEAPAGQLIAWGHLTWTGSTRQANWMLIVDKEIINYLFSDPIDPEILQQIGDNSNWSPYLLRQGEDRFITSLQMRVTQLRQRGDISFSSTGIPILDQKIIRDHMCLFEKLTTFKMTRDGFIATP